MLRDSLLAASVDLVVRRGVAGWSLEGVARGAGCAKGLVLYHYRSKAALLALTAGGIERARWDRRFVALALGAGLEAIDRLWDAMVEDVDSGRFGAWVSLTAAGHLGGSGPRRGNDFRDAVARALGLPAEALGDAASIEAMLEGMELLLSRAANRELIRTGYDRLWTSMLAP